LEKEMAERFADVIQQEREHLHREREELQKRLAEIDREFAAIDAYEATKAGKAKASARQKARAVGTRAATRTGNQRRNPAMPRGSKRDALLEIIRENPAGLRRREILTRMGLKGNKSGEMSVSNALTALTKAHQLGRKDGKYVPALAE
jgi:hypothetical protein